MRYVWLQRGKDREGHGPVIAHREDDGSAAADAPARSIDEPVASGATGLTVGPHVVDPLIGGVLPGAFRVEVLIAAGSFGAVYRARQLTVDRDVAVKVVHAGIAPGSDSGQLFVQEIRAVARIDHRNVVRVHQADVTVDGRLFFAMELLDGRDLQQQLGDGLFAPERAVALARQLLAALDAAHRAALVHADVKPGNAIVVNEPDGERLVLVDFGLSRLGLPDGAASVGGTPAFMAPEQLRHGRVDARSDQFSAALVLVVMLTGWRRKRARDLAPPVEVLATITNAQVRDALARALALSPDQRFPSVAAFAEALTGSSVVRPARPPFPGLASLTEDDTADLHGRTRELEQLTELVCHRRMVIVTAPSGAGKTSLLRAGLMPRLAQLGVAATYASCRADDVDVLATVHDSRSGPPVEQVESPLPHQVLVIDQIEDALQARLVTAWIEAAASAARGAVRASVVLSVREDFLARLLEQLPERGDGVSISRIGPLDAEGARQAIVAPLAARDLDVEPALLDRLLDDLVAAGEQLGAELGWTTVRPVYPPHLQLACSALYERRPPGERVVTLAYYVSLGGFATIVGEHLDRVLDRLTTVDSGIARELFVLLVTSTRLRLARTEEDLAEAVPEAHRARVLDLLEMLRRQGLVVRTQRTSGEPVWELIHDSLVPRILSWLDRRDLSRRRAIELVRHHLRRTTSAAPSLLSRPELREVDRHPEIVELLDREWSATRRPDASDSRWHPSALVQRSRTMHGRSRIAAFALATTVVLGIGAAVRERRNASTERRDESVRRDLDLGLVTFELAPFDWDAVGMRAIPVPIALLPSLAWQLHAPSFDDPHEPGLPLRPERARRLDVQPAAGGLARLDTVEAPGGAAFLVVAGRGRVGVTCARTVVPLRALPGYARRGAGPQRIRIAVPTCDVAAVATVEIPAGPFVFGGLGEPPSEYQREFVERATEQEMALPAFRIDRTEITNAAFAVFATMRDATGIAPPSYIPTPGFEQAAAPTSPASSLTWHEARAYCRYLGKELPSSAEWEKALRGGLQIGAARNRWPRRNFPWGITQVPHQANLNDEVPRGIRTVGAFAADVSPYGVIDMAGSLTEWIGSAPTGETDPARFFRDSWRMTRGGNWSETPANDLVNFMPIENARPGDTRTFTIGWRCVTRENQREQ